MPRFLLIAVFATQVLQFAAVCAVMISLGRDIFDILFFSLLWGIVAAGIVTGVLIALLRLLGHFICALIAVYGATIVWEWPLPLALLLFLWPAIFMQLVTRGYYRAL